MRFCEAVVDAKRCCKRFPNCEGCKIGNCAMREVEDV